MGYQYAQQLVQIYGPWILKRKTHKIFNEKQKSVLKKWKQVHEQYIPWITDFWNGWIEGARKLGINMTFHEVLDLWVGHHPPSRNFLDTGGLPDIPPLACSGVAAWGSATNDKKLVTASTGDHSLSYQIVIVAFPKNGNNFIYSSFGATGEISGAEIWFFGHPAINSKGVAYVHHGGGPKFLEPKKYWGYGIRRAISVMHILRFANSAKEAQEMEKSWPIGDIGWGDQATVGGFYADDTYGYIIEGRKDPIAIREAGLLGETDFLYANNSVAHPDAIHSEWMSKDKDEWMWDEHGGWRPIKPVGMKKSLGLLLAYFSGKISTSDIFRRSMMFAYMNSCNRNKYLFNMMHNEFGNISIDYLKRIYRKSGTIPEGLWKKIEKQFVKNGIWGEISTAHSSNAMTVVTKPSDGFFSLCTGPAKRGLAPMMPSSAISIYNETNAFWDIKLDSNPGKVMNYAMESAQEFVSKAETILGTISKDDPAYDSLKELLNKAHEQLSRGLETKKNISILGGNQEIYAYGKATRYFTRAQVRARQIINATTPPSL